MVADEVRLQKSSRTSAKCRKIIISMTVKSKMAKKGKSQKVAPKEQSDADADQAAGEAGDKKGKKVIEHDLLREIWQIVLGNKN